MPRSPGPAPLSVAHGAEVPLRASFVLQIPATAPVHAATRPPVSPAAGPSLPHGCGTYPFVLSSSRQSRRRFRPSRRVSPPPPAWRKPPAPPAHSTSLLHQLI